MKKILITLLVTALLAACSPNVTGDLTPQPTPGGESTPAVDRPDRPGQQEDGSEVDSENGVDDGLTEVTWRQSPEEVVISVKTFGGFVPENFFRNYIPDAQYFGDGRLIWVDFKENGSRAVLEGQLSPEDLQAILERIETIGFYSWEDRYANPLIADAPDQCIEVTTLERAKSVCEYVEGAPPEFDELYDWLVRGAGASGEPFVPERGFVTSYPIESPSGNFAELAPTWQVQDAPDLAEMQNGVWLEGPALQQAWQIVNAQFSGAQQGGNFYQLSVQVPGVSLEGSWGAE